jgi:hypothetical protein
VDLNYFPSELLQKIADSTFADKEKVRIPYSSTKFLPYYESYLPEMSSYFQIAHRAIPSENKFYNKLLMNYECVNTKNGSACAILTIKFINKIHVIPSIVTYMPKREKVIMVIVAYHPDALKDVINYGSERIWNNKYEFYDEQNTKSQNIFHKSYVPNSKIKTTQLEDLKNFMKNEFHTENVRDNIKKFILVNLY